MTNTLTTQDIVDELTKQLSFRFPRRTFVITSFDDTNIGISLDAFTSPSDEKRIRKFIENLMASYSAIIFRIDHAPF